MTTSGEGTALSIAITLTVHCLVAFVMLFMLQAEPGLDQIFTFCQMAAVHVALLLGLIGPSNGRFWWVPSPDDNPFGVGLLFFIGLAHLLGVGIIGFQFFEQKGFPCEEPVGDDCVYIEELNGDGAYYKPWTFTESLYYCVVIISTVGAGNTFYPTNPLSRAFTIIFGLFGLLIFGMGSSVIRGLFDALLDSCRAMMARVKSSDAVAPNAIAPNSVAPNSVAPKPAEVDAAADDPNKVEPFAAAATSTPSATEPAPAGAAAPLDDDAADAAAVADAAVAAFEPPAAYHTVRGLFTNFVLFLVINYGSAYIFWCTESESEWRFSDALYHCFMVATTICLGDIAPHSHAGLSFAIVHMCVSVVLFGAVLGTVLDALSRRTLEARKRALLARELDDSLLADFDKDGNGVDRAEFVLGMLVALGTLEEADYAPFLRQFDALDKTQNGLLTRDDFTKVLSAKRESAAHAKNRAFVDRVRTHAFDLIMPTGLACFAFVWNTIFGYLLFASGLINSVAIICLLGSSPQLAAPYRQAIALCATAGGLVFASASLIVLSAFAPATYFKLDPMAQEIVLSYLQNERTVVLDEDLDDPAVADKLPRISPVGAFGSVMYVCVLIYMTLVDVQVVMCCRFALRELRAARPVRAPHEKDVDQ